jgi:hypothetical protein
MMIHTADIRVGSSAFVVCERGFGQFSSCGVKWKHFEVAAGWGDVEERFRVSNVVKLLCIYSL